MLHPSLAPLAAWPQFICYRLVSKPDGKTDKIPMCPRGGMASSTDPRTWGTYAEAYAAWTATPGELHGIGFVFTENDPFFFFDMDGAYRDGAGWSQLSQQLLARLGGAAVEVSSSGTGLHVIGTYSSIPAHRCRNTKLHLELYHTERFVALTGTHASGSASVQCDAAIAAIIAEFFDVTMVDGAPAEWTDGPHPDWSGPADDADIIAMALHRDSKSASAAFGGAIDWTQPATFTELWTADAENLGKRYPPDRPGSPYDASRADQAMANQLAFWVGRDCPRMERIMRASALERPKWDDHATYLETTILKAIGFTRNIYNDKHNASAPAAIPQDMPTDEAVTNAGMAPRAGHSFMLASAQVDHFAGCTYIASLNRALMPNGDRLDKARFDVLKGGYTFVLDPEGKAKTTSAWEAFTQSQVFSPPIADRLCFRPELGSGGIFEEAGRRLANFYVTRNTLATPGDPAPFLNHLAIMLPDPRDRLVLLTWMASVVRNPGLKAQWWPVVQGGEGNGKSVLLQVMRYAIGPEYTHLPNMDKMIRNGSNFNGWVEGKLFLGLEEVYAANRREFFEGFKTTVTNMSIPKEAKGVEEETTDNRANGMITTNHKAGVPVTGDNRRYAIFFTAQQSKADSLAAGLTDAYFANEFRPWLFGTHQFAHLGPDYGLRVINHHLRTMPLVAEYDPAQLAIWAPATSSTVEAIETSQGRAEQEIAEAIDEGRCGFAGGWISSVFLSKLLDSIRVNVPPRLRRDLVLSLGYDVHPALEATGGRVNNVIQPDNNKPRLYVKLDSIQALNLSTPADVARAYTDAQSKALSGATSAAQAAFGSK